MHPEDAAELGVTNGERVHCQSSIGQITVVVEIDKSVRRKMVTLPNGYGSRFRNGEAIGPQLNMIMPSNHCEPFTKTPFHKYLPVKITMVREKKESL
jgi:anaerobic selenocysteine-containing dehydrogenase